MTPLYIFDLDGTLALIEHRRHLVEPPEGCAKTDNTLPVCKRGCFAMCAHKPDWPAFFAACVDDQPNWPVISSLMALVRAGAEVQIWSGRSAEVMNETLAWLQKWIFGDGSVDPEEVGLTMRREGDFTPDEQLKASWYDALSGYDRKRLVAVFDDRQKVVDMWRSKGVACFQVAPGDF